MGASRVRTRWVLGLVVAFALVSVLARAAIVLTRGREAFALHGVALGMSARDVHDRFAAPGAGHFRSHLEPEPVLEWTPGSTGTDAGAPYARFEFHAGQLVAARMRLDASDRDAQGAAIDVSPAAVLVRRRASDGRVEVTLVARDCPTHAAEVQRLLTRR